MSLIESFLLEGFPVTSPRGFLGWSNALLLREGRRAIVIDTGGPGDRALFLRRLGEHGVEPDVVDLVILTHLHFDHALNVDLFPRTRIVLSQREYDYVASSEYREREDPGIHPAILPLLARRDLQLVEGPTEVAPGVRVVETPGHTPGSLSVLYSTRGLATVACGDLVKHAAEFLQGPDSEAGRRSLRALRDVAQRLIPGHDRPFMIGPDGRDIRYEGARDLEVSILLDPLKPALTSRWQL